MVIRRLMIGLAIASLVTLAASCQKAEDANANANTGATYTATGSDNSEITTTTENGVRTETRTFRDNPRVSRVVVTTRDGNRTVKVYSPSGEQKDVSTNSPDALHATGDAIADSAGWVKDKSVTAAEKTKEGAKTVADKTVDTSKTVADKTVDTTKTVVDKTKQGTKTVANKTVDTTKTVADKTKTGVKKTGRAIKKVVTP